MPWAPRDQGKGVPRDAKDAWPVQGRLAKQVALCGAKDASPVLGRLAKQRGSREARARPKWPDTRESRKLGLESGDNDSMSTQTMPSPGDVASSESSAAARQPLRLVVVTGMSGAGRSTAANALEDLGWYVVDNLPPMVLTEVCELAERTALAKLAVVIDVRTRAFFEMLPTMFADLNRAGVRPEIVFLEAADDVIVRRQESVRRPHPLQGEGRLLDGIVAERHKLATLRAAADLVVDTSSLNVHQLTSRISSTFGGDNEDRLRMTLMSFGFKNGLPVDADLVLDVRFLPNPHWVPELRPQTGLSRAVADYVLGAEGAAAFLDQAEKLLGTVGAGYLREGKRFATVALGCTGGKHRSTAMTEELARRLQAAGHSTTVLHRDLGRE